MTRFVVIMFLAGALFSDASAQTIPVRSGEHDSFTRLVLQIPKGVDWSVASRARSANVKLELPGAKFDIGQVFDRIPRSRLLGVTQSGAESTLTLDLGCDCDVVGFTQSGTLLVVDISDPPKPWSANPDRLVPTNPKPYRFNLAVRNRPGEMKTQLNIHTEKPKPPTPEPVVPLDPVSPSVAARQRLAVGVNASEQRLLEQIVRATDQGLVTPIATVKTGPSHAPSTELPHPDGTGLSAITVVDRDMRLASDGPIETECIADGLVALGDWGGSTGFSKQIGKQRSQLFEEFDHLNSHSVETLAKLYLHFGFGAEARRTLLLDSSNGFEQGVLNALAAIVDTKEPAKNNPFSGQQHCKSDVSLWAILAEPNLVRNADSDAVVRAFSRLPVHLRAHFGPHLSQIFSNADDLKTATSILRAIDRSGNRPGPGQELASARIELGHGEPESAARKMRDVVATNSEFSPQALVELVEMQWHSRAPVPPDLPELTAAYSAELRRSELGPRLRRAHAISLALAGNFDASFAVLGTSTNDVSSSALIPLLTLLTENADDVMFLKHGLWQTNLHKSGLPIDLGDKIARRFLDLGFPEPVFDLLASSGPDPANTNRRLLRAEAANAVNTPHRALVELLGLAGPEAARLRAVALWDNGDIQLASQALLETDLIEDATRGFWLGDSPVSKPGDNDTKFGRIAEVSEQLARALPASSDMTPLAHSRTLLADSASARDEIENLLRSVTLAPQSE